MEVLNLLTLKNYINKNTLINYLLFFISESCIFKNIKIRDYIKYYIIIFLPSISKLLEILTVFLNVFNFILLFWKEKHFS